MTFLQHIGGFFKKVLNVGTEAAKIAEPVIDLVFPQIGPIYNSAIGLAVAAEASATAATGTGPQKLSQLVENITPQVQSWAKANGVVWDQAAITKWASAVVDTLNMIPAPTGPMTEVVPVSEPAGVSAGVNP